MKAGLILAVSILLSLVQSGAGLAQEDLANNESSATNMAENLENTDNFSPPPEPETQR
jgi:hypothetical protein